MNKNNIVNESVNVPHDQGKIRHGAEALIAAVAILSTAFIFWVMNN
jgi:hypothetical protein